MLSGDVVALPDCACVVEERDGEVEESLTAMDDCFVVGVFINRDAKVSVGHGSKLFWVNIQFTHGNKGDLSIALFNIKSFHCRCCNRKSEAVNR